MRHAAALGVGLLTWLLAGCVGGTPDRDTAGPRRGKGLSLPSGPDVVQMDVALLECPLADPYLNDGLWATADEQVAAPERLAALEENGFRIGLIGGLIPDELQELLTSKRSNPDPRKRVVAAGRPAALDLGPPAERCRCRVVQNGQAEEINLERAQCQLMVVPSPAPDGKVRLRFTPRVEHGARLPHFQPADDGSGFVMEVERARQAFPGLGWEVTLGPNEYVVIGTRFDHPRTLGFAGFVQADGTNDVQRLLVIRTSRQGGAPAGTEGPESSVSRKAPPLALQAQLP